MAELPEDTAGTDAPDVGGSGLLHGIGLLKSITALVVALTALLTALNQTGVIGGGTSSDADAGPPIRGKPTAETERTPTETESGGGEDFSDPPGLFHPARLGNGSARFEGSSLVVTTARPGARFVHVADMDAQRDVRVSARAVVLSSAGDWGAGLVCRHTGAQTYYLASVISGGRYNIVRYQGSPNGRSLTKGIQSDGALAGVDHEVALRCVGGNPTTLTLEVDGKPVDERVDPEGLPAGNVGLRVGSDGGAVSVRFERYTLRGL